MASLNYFLDRTDQSVRSIQTLKFKSPGIFTNAIVKKPNITTLLKDPTIDESSLYKIVKPKFKKQRIGKKSGNDGQVDDYDYVGVKPERVDGKSIYIDRSFSELSRQDQEVEGENRDSESGGSKRRIIVQIPDLINVVNEPINEVMSSPTKRGGGNNIYNNNSYFVTPSTDDVQTLINRTDKLIKKYPTLIKNQDSVIRQLNEYQDNYESLKQSVNNLELEINEQKKQLNILNINYSDIGSPVKEGRSSGNRSYSHTQVQEEEEEFDIDEIIRKEEEEIKRLEQQLNERQKI